MPKVYSKYVPPVIECMARNYDGDPVPVAKIRSCLGASKMGGEGEVYSGIKYGVQLGYIEEVPYGKLTRYKPTLTGVVKGAIMDAVMEALGIMDGRVIDVTERLGEILYSNFLLDLPDAILVALHGTKGIECICCTEDGGCFSYKRIEGKERVYLGMITLKVLAGVEVRDVKPRDYWLLFSFVRDEALFYLRRGFRGYVFHLMRGFKGYDPEAAARATPLITLFLLRFDHNLFVSKSKVRQLALKLCRQ
jgi:hypothetical protein